MLTSHFSVCYNFHVWALLPWSHPPQGKNESTPGLDVPCRWWLLSLKCWGSLSTAEWSPHLCSYFLCNYQKFVTTWQVVDLPFHKVSTQQQAHGGSSPFSPVMGELCGTLCPFAPIDCYINVWWKDFTQAYPCGVSCPGPCASCVTFYCSMKKFCLRPHWSKTLQIALLLFVKHVI
jgi:hypothetical protein